MKNQTYDLGFLKISGFGTIFASKPWILRTNFDEISMFFDFFDFLLTLRSHIFISTEPISNFLDVLKSYVSDSFISAMLEA